MSNMFDSLNNINGPRSSDPQPLNAQQQTPVWQQPHMVNPQQQQPVYYPQMVPQQPAAPAGATMTQKLFFACVLIVGVVAFTRGTEYDVVKFVKNLITDVEPDSPDVKPDDNGTGVMVPSIVEVVKKADAKKAKRLGSLYVAMADVLDRADPMPSSRLRSWLIASDTYMIKGTDLVGSVPGFGDAKDKLFTELLGLEDRNLTKDELTKVSKLCKDIASSCGAK